MAIPSAMLVFLMLLIGSTTLGCLAKKDGTVNSSSSSATAGGLQDQDPWQIGGTPPPPSPTPLPLPTVPGPEQIVAVKDVLKNFPKGAASLAELCLNPGADRFTTTFCGNNPPQITSLAQLHTALGLTNAADSACTTNSVSLVKNETSVLNPRCIKFSANGQDADATAVGYLRAALTFAEVVVRDATTGALRFFLVDFNLPCEKTPAGCTNADFYLQSAESGWVDVSFYEDTKLQNTILDCTMCHQPGGAAAPKTLRMAETDNPWRHWFRNNRVCGTTLTADFNAAHTGETQYAGLTLAQIANGDPARLENFVEDNGFAGAASGNNFYNSGNIEGQTDATAGQPQSNVNPSTSATWTAAYNQRSALQNLAAFGGVMMPYRDCKQSDPTLLPMFTALYRDVRAGNLPPAMMPHLPDVNLQSVQALRDRSLLPRASTDARTILTNACMSCHNSNLNQNISRARFNAQDLTRNIAAVYDTAINRIARANDDLKKMPPNTFMNLTAAEIELLTVFFQQQKALAVAAAQ